MKFNGILLTGPLPAPSIPAGKVIETLTDVVSPEGLPRLQYGPPWELHSIITLKREDAEMKNGWSRKIRFGLRPLSIHCAHPPSGSSDTLLPPGGRSTLRVCCTSSTKSRVSLPSSG
ncbi:hypothetical protein D3C78_1610980 [compost metagenome]